MGNSFFNEYPYTDFHELNLSWVIKELRTFATTLDQFVSINALKYADPIQWNITTQYEKNTIVIDPQTGTAYISVAPVPAGVALTNEDYWTIVFDLGAFVTRAAQNFTNKWESETTTTATFSTPENGWLVWGDVLYKALVNITAGDAYVVGSNIEHITMEDIYTVVLQNLANEVQARIDEDTAINNKIGDLDNLTTTDKTSIVNAINELVTNVVAVIASVGDLNDLTTTDKTSVVNAINELVAIVTNVGDLNDLTTTDKTTIVNAINEIVNNVGDLNDLQTTDKSSIVNAINELASSGSLISTTLLYPDMFTGTDSNKLQACMNALQSTGGTIVINRNLELTSDVIVGLPSDDVQNYITVIGIGKNATIKMNGAKLVGDIDANIRHCGQVKFINIKFEGTDSTTDQLIVTDYILRAGFIHCTFSNFLHVFLSTSREMQSYVIEDCVFLKPITRAFKITGTARWFDVRINNCRSEQLTEFIDFDTNNHHVCCAYGVNVSNCCIESCETRYAIRLQNFNNFAIRNCYFEDNLISIKLDEAEDAVGLLIDGNFFSEPLTPGHVALHLPSSVTGVWGAITNNSFYNGGIATYFLDGNVTGTIKVDTRNNNGYSYSNTSIVQYISNPNITRLITPVSVTVSSAGTPTLVGNIRTLVDELGSKTVVGLSMGAVSAPTGGFSGYLTLYGDNLYAVFTVAQTYTFRFVTDCI